jgi:hypothetical protein
MFAFFQSFITTLILDHGYEGIFFSPLAADRTELTKQIEFLTDVTVSHSSR